MFNLSDTSPLFKLKSQLRFRVVTSVAKNVQLPALSFASSCLVTNGQQILLNESSPCSWFQSKSPQSVESFF